MVIWIIGMSSSGKTVVAKEVYRGLKGKYRNTVLLDGDHFRDILGEDLGYTIPDRKKNADRFCRVCKFLDDQGINVVGAILSLFPESRQWNRENYSNYFEVFLDVPFEELLRRDVKGLYKRALNGEIIDVVGVDIPFTPPEHPDLIIKNDGQRSIKDIGGEILSNVLPRMSENGV